MALARRLLFLGFIFGCTSIAWLILSATLDLRTQTADRTLRERVKGTWGEPLTAIAPMAQFAEINQRPLSTRADAVLNLDYRQKGLLWYSTYRVNLTAQYTYRN